MSGKKIITVFGATGRQGGSVAKHLLKDGTFAVRAVTRKPTAPAAEELKKLGAEVVEADLENKESVKNALKGAYGVFGVTNFWDPAVLYEGEVRQGKLLGDAVKEEGIQHYVWSSLEHSHIPHYESKAIVTDYLRELKIPFTDFWTTFYYENLYKGGFFGVSKNDKGEYNLSLPIVPTAKIASYAVQDTGGFVLQILLHPEQYIGKIVGVATEFISLEEMAQQFTKVFGHKLNVIGTDLEGMKAFAEQGWSQNEIYLNLKFYVDHQSGIRDTEATKKLYPAAQKWEDLLRNEPDKFI